ncbi:MAG: M13 family metallopeptidase [Salinivirgaceae bacterium]|nr:M13 family metallopeptidase [Salinivirgaceae bacterium]
MKKIALFAAVMLLLSSCADKAPQLPSGISFADMDTTFSPVNDFYQYSCGGWQKAHPLTPEYSSYNQFSVVFDNNAVRLNELFSEMAKTEHQFGSNEQKVGDLFRIAMDSVHAEKVGVQPIVDDFKVFTELKSFDRFSIALARQMAYGQFSFFVLYADANPKNSKECILWTSQYGLGMGDRDYYLNSDFADLQQAYVQMMEKALKIVKYDKLAKVDAAKMAQGVYELETRLANAFMSKTDRQNPHKTTNMMTVAEWNSLIPSVNLTTILEMFGLEKIDSLNVCQPDYFRALDSILTTTNLEVLKAYMALNITRNASDYLTKELSDTYFDFYGSKLRGTPKMQPRWKRMTEEVSDVLGDAVGQLYVERYFPPEAKERMLELIENLQDALNARIKSNTWMSRATKKNACEKLASIRIKVGYPNKWRDYSALRIENDNLYLNMRRHFQFDVMQDLYKVGKPTDPDEWLMTPQTVNAYYNPSTNEICFPAAILQPPFFNYEADDAVNYGGIGVVIGHEMTHGFDNQGRNFDKDGNLNNWWTEADGENFEQRAESLVKYFNNIVVLDTMHADGQFTLGENIADNGGLNVSFAAMKKAQRKGKIQKTVDGFTAEQRFFLSYGLIWANNIRPEEIVNRTQTDEHSLARWRVNGALPHIDAFYDAFDVKKGDTLYLDPKERVRIW